MDIQWIYSIYNFIYTYIYIYIYVCTYCKYAAMVGAQGQPMYVCSTYEIRYLV